MPGIGLVYEMTSGNTGLIYDIQRFSVHDGPGIRTTVFLKGCPLQCAWCHNPESQSQEAELAFFKARCMECGNCVSACPSACHALIGTGHAIKRSDCTACGKCTENCFSNALAVIGKTVTVQEVMDDVTADSLFYQVSGGGMTLSGGEPMFQPRFTLELLKAAKVKNIHTCLETCGFCAPEHLVNAVPYTDLFLFDLKTTADIYEQWTGVPLEPILHSLRALDEAGGRIVLRCPLIPHVNINDTHIAHIAQIAASLKHVTAINLEPYHPIGLSKSEAIGRLPEYEETNMLGADAIKQFAEKLQKMTALPVVVV